MRRIPLFTVLWLAPAPVAAQAIQVHWSSGAVNLAFTEATRCTLVVQADSAEVTLPPEWRLLWVADSTEVEVVALDSLDVCTADTAQVYDVEGPATPEDSTANRWTATGNFVIGYPSLAGAEPEHPADGIRFSLLELRPGTPLVRFIVELPAPASPCVSIYDVAGRKLRVLASGHVAQGCRELIWDCRDAQGAMVWSGVYFARLTNVGAPRTLHVPVVR